MFYKKRRGAVMNFYTEVYMSKYKQLITRSGPGCSKHR